MTNYKTLYEISTLLNSETDIRSLVELAIDKVIEATKAQCGLLLIGKNVDELLFECARHRDKIDIERPNTEISKTLIKKVFDSGNSLLLKNAMQDPNLDSSASMRALHLISIACAPLHTNGEIFGVIYVDNRDVTASFSEETKELLEALSKLISVPLKNSLGRKRMVERERRLKAELREYKGYGRIIGSSPAIRRVLDLIDQVADSEAIVLITGETGTGKELIAREIHAKSKRKNNELVTLNCSAIPQNLLEAELFGYEKGAFTGADKSKAGWFEVADRGTIFLDEIGEMSLDAQVRLLRLVQFGEYTPVGSRTTKKIDVRIIAATNRDLAEMVKQGAFRKDLYYRLNVIELKLPALRERSEDIPEITQDFLKRFANQSNRKIAGLSDEASQALLNYEFPGNVRELENIIQRAVLLGRGEAITAADLHLILGGTRSQTLAETTETNFKAAKEKCLAEFERNFLIARLKDCNGNITHAAERAGMYKKNFMDKMGQYGLKGEDYKK